MNMMFILDLSEHRPQCKGEMTKTLQNALLNYASSIQNCIMASDLCFNPTFILV